MREHEREFCCGHHRRFLTKEEEIEKLGNYKKNLEAEIKGVERRLEELRKTV